MARLCTVCSHTRRNEIDLALVLNQRSYRDISRHFGVSDDALYRHKTAHLEMSWELSKGLTAMLSGNNLLDKLSALDERTLNLLDQAERSGDLRTALVAIRESRGNIEAFSRIGVQTDIEARLAALEEDKADA